LLFDIQEELIKLDIEGLSLFLKGEYMNFHFDKRNTLLFYLEKFKVTNKKLKLLRDEYYVELAKEKLIVISLT
jgi:hypothetical protein